MTLRQGVIVPNGTGIAMGFPQILSETAAVKTALRDRIRDRRRARSTAERAAVARALVGIVLELPEIQAAHCVALYAAMPTEPQTRPLREALRHQGIGVGPPLVRPDGLEWGWDTGAEIPGSDLSSRRLGGAEPGGPSLGPRGVLAGGGVPRPGSPAARLGTSL